MPNIENVSIGDFVIVFEERYRVGQLVGVE